MAVFSVVDLVAVLAAANVIYVSTPSFLWFGVLPLTPVLVHWPGRVPTLLPSSGQVPRPQVVDFNTMARGKIRLVREKAPRPPALA